MIDFPESNFMYNTITTANIYRNVHHLIKVKIHLHHSHISEEILGYIHDFCNWTLRENKSEIAMIARNWFYVFSSKRYRTTAWGTKDLNIGGTNLTHINYRNIGEVKFIDTIKYYQKSLAALATTLIEDEKNSVKHLTIQFFNQNHYFSEIWKYLGDAQKNTISDIIQRAKESFLMKK